MAQHLREWLPNVLQAAEVWMSDVDIEAGMRGINEIFTNLEKARVGIICLTPENSSAPWLMFEAGAISKQVSDKARVCPYLLDLETGSVPKPIAEFQSVPCTQDGTKRLLKAVNKSLEKGILADDKVEAAFEVWWPKLESKLRTISDISTALSSVEKKDDVLTEVLGSVREILRRFDQDREFYTSPQAMLKGLASRKEIKEELTNDMRETMKSIFENPAFMGEALSSIFKEPSIRQIVDKESQQFAIASLNDMPEFAKRFKATFPGRPSMAASLSRVEENFNLEQHGPSSENEDASLSQTNGNPE